tara:strand:- start:6408 stop:7919 length:1512 start_codon:yes stop_codon:yes gene_type:complete
MSTRNTFTVEDWSMLVASTFFIRSFFLVISSPTKPSNRTSLKIVSPCQSRNCEPFQKSIYNPHLSHNSPSSSQITDPITAHLSPKPPPHLPRTRSSRRVLRTPSRIRHRARKPKRAIEQIRRALVPSSRSRNLRLGILARRLGCIVRFADVGELVAQRVGDDVGIQRFTLAAASDRVGDLKCEFGGGAVALATLESYGRRAKSEVCPSEGASGGARSCVVVGVVGVVVGVAPILLGVSTLCDFSRVATVASINSSAVVTLIRDISSGIALIRVVLLIGITSVVVASLLLSTTTRRCATRRSLGSNEVTEAGLVKEVKDTQTVGSKRIGLGLLAESSNSTINIDIRVDEWGDTTELRSGRERRVTTDILDIAVGEGVGVLLSGNEADGCGDGISASTELSDDLIGTAELLHVSHRLPHAGVLISYLSARVGCAQKVADSGTSDCRGGASITTLNCRDGSNRDLFLTETGLDVGDDRGDEDNFRDHDGEYGESKIGSLDVKIKRM